MASETSTYKAPSLDLDPSFYRLDDQEKAFFQQLTGITDDGELKEHIIRVQAKAYKVGCVISATQSSQQHSIRFSAIPVSEVLHS
jgi:hypothetical protein